MFSPGLAPSHPCARALLAGGKRQKTRWLPLIAAGDPPRATSSILCRSGEGAGTAARFVACRHLTYRVARMLDGGGVRMEAMPGQAAGLPLSRAGDARGAAGGMGYAEESALSRYFVDARVLSIFEGAEETLALKGVARSLLEDALAAPAPASD